MPKLNKNHGTEALRSKLILIYANLVKSGILFPKRSDLIAAGLSRDSMRHHFGTIGNLRKIAKERHPDAFKNELSLDDYLSNSNLKKIHSRVKKYNKFFITTAIAGQAVHKDFLASINQFCKINKAKLILLPSHDPAHNLDSEVNWMFDENIKHTEFDYIFEDLRLNSNLMISGIRVTAKQINPVTGLSELSQKEGSCIFASPKQSLEYDAVSANRLPHARMTTGAITLPNYNTTKGNSLRTSYIATFQHVIGGIIVEIADNNIFHFTQVQADKNGSFCHMGKEYSKNKCVPVKVSFIMGDLHAGEHDIKALNAWKEIIKEVKAYQVVFHDTFDGKSISHWTEQDALVRAELAMSGENSLENELKLVRDILDDVLSIPSVKKGVIVKSNHDDFLDRYLKRGGFMKDPINFKLGCQLAAEVVNTNKDVLEHGINLVGVGKHHKKIKFLGVNEDYLIGDVHAGAHGDRSSNGSKGAIKSLAKSFSKGVFGHSHTPGIFKKAFQVGTTSKLRQGYNKGPSSWVHCSALVYDNGQVQLINALDGKWRSNKK
jgi:hypothetical protein